MYITLVDTDCYSSAFACLKFYVTAGPRAPFKFKLCLTQPEQRRSGDVEMSDIYVTNRKSDIYVTHLDDIYWTRETAGLALVTYLSRVLSDKYATHMCH